MRRFARLFGELDATTRTTVKVEAMAAYFGSADPADAAWAVHFLSGGRPKRLVQARRLAAWAMEEAAIPDWLFDECYTAVGDLAETIALLLPVSDAAVDLPLHEWIEEKLLPLAGQPEDVQRREIVHAWSVLDGTERFVWNKLITGGFRVGVSRALVIRALASMSGLEEAALAHRLMGGWSPTAEAFRALVSPDVDTGAIWRPYPFFLAYALEDEPATLGQPDAWQAEWKWDGIRAQLVRRAGQTFLWSRGEDLVTERFPELDEAAALLPDGTVLDGEIMPWKEGPLPFAQLQRRIGRKRMTPRILAEVPVVLVVYDLLEIEGEDVREQPLSWRRQRLESLLADAPSGLRQRVLLSPLIEAHDWQEIVDARTAARARGAEGLMLKRLDAPYGVGRRRGPWWKWKVEPYSVDAVMVYAQAGHGRRASLHTDYTFALWRDGELVPFAKAYSGLTDEELRRLDNWIRRNTIERFGPVRAVEPEQVFEVAFEGIRKSTRHKSGVAVRFPRILRWRHDKKAADADTLAALEAMMATSS